MILESIVTTVSPEGRVNIAPMGPIVRPPSGDAAFPTFCLRPYEGSRTCGNLLDNGKAVIHVTDDVLLLARAAIGTIDPTGLVCQAEGASREHVRLVDCHRWFAIEVTHAGGTPPRHELVATCIAEGTVRPFFGFNRAKHAVIEAAILATRIGMIDSTQIKDELQRLAVPVQKTAGPDELAAFELVQKYIEQRMISPAEYLA
ncbi:DUF447 domain-containing protein [Allorhodopirellula heiligendammensis]|uniref:Uncharacterized protein n=1 Tax=Allorhodopirellula heiligendammensis TaxID=2714739 RepID=A0A5C6C040_9BACT|nr:DUF447 domain-containing protein [Allorhodopirellula heiligendammensis]TWU17001.1 hypothetical protein Poly21_42100 [Allorhodopirellula heiligendammensis]